jgi:prolipoprotein diacylglyceryl transferase
VFTWNIDPDFFHLPDFIGGRGIRYYGVLYAIALMGAFYIWQWQMLRGGKTREVAERFLTAGVLAVIVGARLGHCLFYEPERYLSDPITILYFWQGGLASHGSTIALLLVMFWFARREKMPFMEVVDRLSISVAWGATLVRIGNFMNSEIVGRVTDGPFKVKFPRHDRSLLTECPGECGRVARDLCGVINDRCYGFAQVPWRHPSQIYEAMMGLGILIILWLVDRKYGESRPLGLMGSLFLLIYFSGRFSVEFVKEFQTLDQGLTMGQYLSLPFMIMGAIGVIKALKAPKTPAAAA